jgi:hypothetical protein
MMMHGLENPKFKATEPLKLGHNHNKITNIFSGDRLTLEQNTEISKV